MAPPIHLKTKGTFSFLGNKGMVYTVDLKENCLPIYRTQITQKLMGKIVCIEGVEYRVKGIEMFAVYEGFEHKDIGILVKPIKP